jgi:carbon monoxide dehydrogenase subunit G
MRKKIAVAALAVAVVAGAAGLASFISAAPSIRSGARSILVAAPPEVVLAQLTNPGRWVAWSPWESHDHAVKRTYGGPTEGAGASYYWSGGGAGQGRLTVIEASAEAVKVERETEQPTRSLTDFELRLAREGAGTRVSWLMQSEVDDRWARVRALLPGRPQQDVGQDLEKGLARLKAVVEVLVKGERWRVERSALVAAPPPAVLAEIVDLRRWTAWSPWERASMRLTYGGPTEGAGASYYWSSDADAGQGRLTIIGTSPERVAVEMELPGPRQLLGDLEFRLAPEGDGSRVTWTIAGDLEVPGEALGRAGDPETTIGPELEKGLARLAARVEASTKVRLAR